MQIIIKNNQRILINEHKQIDISDEKIIKYTGIYYKPKNQFFEMIEIETKFIGKIESQRGNADGPTGIYIIPLYMRNYTNFEWMRILNYEAPKNKYFLYPHLLMLPNNYYHNQPLYFLHTCEEVNVNEFNNITKTIDLHYMS